MPKRLSSRLICNATQVSSAPTGCYEVVGPRCVTDILIAAAERKETGMPAGTQGRAPCLLWQQKTCLQSAQGWFSPRVRVVPNIVSRPVRAVGVVLLFPERGRNIVLFSGVTNLGL